MFLSMMGNILLDFSDLQKILKNLLKVLKNILIKKWLK